MNTTALTGIELCRQHLHNFFEDEADFIVFKLKHSQDIREVYTPAEEMAKYSRPYHQIEIYNEQNEWQSYEGIPAVISESEFVWYNQHIFVAHSSGWNNLEIDYWEGLNEGPPPIDIPIITKAHYKIVRDKARLKFESLKSL